MSEITSESPESRSDGSRSETGNPQVIALFFPSSCLFTTKKASCRNSMHVSPRSGGPGEELRTGFRRRWQSRSVIRTLRELYEADPHVRVLQFRRNFGHHIAITGGMDAVRGEVVVMMDSDLQDQPEEIPAMLAKLEEGFDVVYGIRMNKQHSLLKRVNSALFFWVMRHVVRGFEPNSGIFRIARRRVIDAVKQCRETNRLDHRPIELGRVPADRHACTARQAVCGRDQVHAKQTDPSGGDLDPGIQRFPFANGGLSRPVRIVPRPSCLPPLSSSDDSPFGLGEIGWPSMMAAILFLGGIQLLSLGAIGQYVGRIFTEPKAARCISWPRTWTGKAKMTATELSEQSLRRSFRISLGPRADRRGDPGGAGCGNRRFAGSIRFGEFLGRHRHRLDPDAPRPRKQP